MKFVTKIELSLCNELITLCVFHLLILLFRSFRAQTLCLLFYVVDDNGVVDDDDDPHMISA